MWKDKFSYDELLGKKFVWYPNDTVYNIAFNPQKPLETKCTYNPYADESWKNGKELKITAILRPKEGTSYGSLKSGFYYTQALAEEIIADGMKSQIVTGLNAMGMDTITSMKTEAGYQGMAITYNFSYWIKGQE